MCVQLKYPLKFLLILPFRILSVRKKVTISWHGLACSYILLHFLKEADNLRLSNSKIQILLHKELSPMLLSKIQVSETLL